MLLTRWDKAYPATCGSRRVKLRMRYLPIIETVGPDVTPSDPTHYLRLADLAMLYGSRDEAEAMITMTYLAFDLMLTGS
jgi:hypothetical protein